MEASTAPAALAKPPRGAQHSPRLLRLASDERLVGLVRNGSQPAFEVLYDRHHRGILSFCRHMLGTREEAEDALQHTFMAAYRDLVSSHKDIQLRAWLYTIARNRCLSMLRARRERPSDELDDVVTVGLATEVEVRQDLQDMLHDLAALPEDQRAALVLSELGDMAHDEIATVVGCPREKVKALVFQARSSLHASRDARDTDCTQIRELLSSLRGGALRRTNLKRHLRECAGCREFSDEVKRQRKAMAVLMPVIPTLGLKESALAAAFSGGGTAGGAAAATAGGAAAAAGGGAVASGGSGALVAKVLVVAAVAGGGTAGVSRVVDSDPARDRTPAAERSQGPKAPLPATAPAAATGDATPTATAEGEKGRRGRDDRGREFARTRGKGNKRGLNGTQPGQSDEKVAKREARKQAAAQRKMARQQARTRRRATKQAKPVRTVKPQPTPRVQAPKPERTPRPKPTVAPTPEPTPAAVPTEPAAPDGGKGKPARNG